MLQYFLLFFLVKILKLWVNCHLATVIILDLDLLILEASKKEFLVLLCQYGHVDLLVYHVEILNALVDVGRRYFRLFLLECTIYVILIH